MATVSAHTPIAGMTDYNATKAAMLAFSKTLSFELAADGILVNCVAPAFIHSPLWEPLADSQVPALGANREEVYRNLTDQFVTLKRFLHRPIVDVTGVSFRYSEARLSMRAVPIHWRSVHRRCPTRPRHLR